VFRAIGDRPPLWESRLPPEVLRLPEELARVDALLDDPAFFAPFAPYFHPVLGRPSTPAEWYLRMMFLKFRYRLGCESLCAEVSDSISWRRFCRIEPIADLWFELKVMQAPYPTAHAWSDYRPCGPNAARFDTILAGAFGQQNAWYMGCFDLVTASRCPRIRHSLATPMAAVGASGMVGKPGVAGSGEITGPPVAWPGFRVR